MALTDLPYEVVIQPVIGRSLIAKRPIATGELILIETPLVACQFSWNRFVGYRCCEHCLRPLETVQENVARLAKSPISLPYLDCCVCDTSQHCCCDLCKVGYCSVACKDQAWKQYHQLLCPNSSNDLSNALKKLDEIWRQTHYPPETTTVFLIVRLMAMLKLSDDHQRSQLLSLLNSMCSQTTNAGESLTHKLLDERFQGDLNLLLDCLTQLNSLTNDVTAQWLIMSGLRQMFALIGRNGQGIGTSSLSAWRNNVMEGERNRSNEEKEQFEQFLEQLYDQLEEVTGTDFLNCEGSGLYAVQSAANHSCTPNAEIQFLHNNSTLSLLALQPIAAGHEILISYIGECELDRSRHSRQKLLCQNYLFNCNCQRCIDELDQPDVTSEEEDSDSDETVENIDNL